MKSRIIIIGALLISLSIISCGPSRQDKTVAIINKLNLVENQKESFKIRIDHVKYLATANDSIRIIELEKQLTEDEIVKRIGLAFDELFTDEEINDIYEFVQTSAFEKFYKTGEFFQIINSQFGEINKEIDRLRNNLSQINESPLDKFEPIPIEKEDGFYAIVGNSYSTKDKDIKLQDNPSLTLNDIEEVKTIDNNGRPEISIEFTKDGARKFYRLTKENIGRPIAIVIGKQIVSMPTVNSEIMSGKATVSGNFSKEEVDKMIDILSKKNITLNNLY